jgi:cytochrome c oxidase subunit III
MPAIFTPHKTTEIERKNPGTGGKPPLDRRPTGGGGDGENWENRPNGRRGPRELIARYRMMVLFALAGDLMFFVALISAFFVRQSSGHIDPRSNSFVADWHAITIPSILWLNTAVLLLSTITMELARRQLFREVDVMDEWLGLGRPATKRTAPWIIATFALGCTFLVGQWVAWNQLWIQGYHFSSTPAGYFFYLITGAHGAHLILGLLSLCGAFLSLYLLKKLEYRQIVVDCSAWYWHFMGVFWIVLVALLVFGQ